MRTTGPRRILAGAALVWLCACGGGKGGGGSTDAGPDGAAADGAADVEVDGAVPYQGVTQGGVVPDAPAYEEPEPDDGPFEVETTCCERSLRFDALPGETTAVLEADFDVLDDVELELNGDAFSTEQCMPEATAIRYRLHVTLDTDAGTEERARTDPDQPSFEDPEGERWNLYHLESCE